MRMAQPSCNLPEARERPHYRKMKGKAKELPTCLCLSACALYLVLSFDASSSSAQERSTPDLIGGDSVWNILALRVEFPEEEPDDPTTTGDGTFDLRSFEEALPSYEFPYDTPPHNRQYFEWHLQALANYYDKVSEGKIDIRFDVFPAKQDSSYKLRRTMISYGNGRNQDEVDQRLVDLFKNALALADSVEGDNLDFKQYNSFLIIHAGIDGSTGALNDIPSAYLSPRDFDTFVGGPVFVEDGSFAIDNGWILPESISQNGVGGLNGTAARIFGNQLGLPGLSNFKDNLPAVGGWSLMDTGFINVGAGLLGYVPSHPMAWSKIELGWIEPLKVTRDTTLTIAATDISSHHPKAVMVPIDSDEYFLLENRQMRRREDELPDVEYSTGDSAGVWLSLDSYDAYIPGSGILIWHIDEAVISGKRATGSINDDPVDSGIDLEEADGYEDIGNPIFDRIAGIAGSKEDPFFVGGTTAFSPSTVPSSDSKFGAVTGITIVVKDSLQDEMTVEITFNANKEGWPLSRPSGFIASPKTVDVNGDGEKEIIAVSRDGNVHIWRSDGTTLSAFETDSGVLLDPAVGDVDGDLKPDVLLVHENGDVSAWNSESTSLLWRMEGIGASTAPIISNVDADAAGEVIVGLDDGSIAILNGQDGSLLRKVETGRSKIVGIAIKGKDIIAVNEEGELFIVGEDGSGEQVPVGNIEGRPSGSPVLGDTDGDGKVEIILLSEDGILTVLREDVQRPLFSADIGDDIRSSPILTDLDGDGSLEVVFTGEGKVHAWRFNGIPEANFPLILPLKDKVGGIASSPIAADIDGDGDQEIIFGTSQDLVYAIRSDGQIASGFPLTSIGEIVSSLAIDDLDGDNRLELCALTASGTAHVWDISKIASSYTGTDITWGQSNAGPANSGVYPGVISPRPQSVRLLPSDRAYCYPNPIDGDSAHLRFFLGGEARINVKMFNGAGELVGEVSKDDLEPRTDNEIVLDMRDYSSGLYIFRLEATGNGKKEEVFIRAAVSK